MKRVIFSTDDMYNDAFCKEWIEEMQEINPGMTFDAEDYAQHIWDCLDDERCNLNRELDGVIVGYAILGLWDGKHRGGRVFGSNLNSFLQSESDDPEYYSDSYNIRSILPHHDGTNTVLYRLAKDMATAENLVYQIAYEGMTEKQFCRATKSLNPFVSDVYGWPYRKKGAKSV